MIQINIEITKELQKFTFTMGKNTIYCRNKLAIYTDYSIGMLQDPYVSQYFAVHDYPGLLFPLSPF